MYSVVNRLKATEEALRAAQATIARQETREQELRRLVVSNGIAQDAIEENPVIEAKVSALKAVQDQKVRALMRSINQLQDQLQGLKSQEKEHRRSALIQELRNEQREQELIIDVLKQTLQEKLPEFQDSRILVNEFVLRKTVGGPIRFRPKTREELENELQALGQNFQRTVEKLKKDGQRIAATKDERTQDSDEKEEGEAKEEKASNINCVAIDEEQHDKLEQLRAQLAAKSITIHAQAQELAEAYAAQDQLKVVEDQIARKKHKIALLRDQVERQQLENVGLVREKEALAEKCLQLQEEAQFLQNISIEDAGAKDEERLHQLELIHTLRSREMELQDELERQQKLRAKHCDMVNQQVRILEKEKKLAMDEAGRWQIELVDQQKKCLSSQEKVRALKLAVEEEREQKIVLTDKIVNLDAKLAQLETLAQDERVSSTQEATEEIKALEKLAEERNMAVKKSNRQLNAAKLLARQANKEKEKLLLRISILEAEQKL